MMTMKNILVLSSLITSIILSFIIALEDNKYIFIAKVSGVYKNKTMKIASTSSFIPDIGKIVSIYRGKIFLTNGYIISHIGNYQGMNFYLVKPMKTNINIRIGDKIYILNPKYEPIERIFKEKK